MKRKRGAKKAPKKGKRNDHAELNDAAAALVSINIEDTTCLDQNKGNQHDCEMDNGPQVVGVDKLNDNSSIEADQHKDSFIGQPGPVLLKVKLRSSKALGHHRTRSNIQTFSGTDKSNQQAASEKNMHGEKDVNTCSDGLTLEMQNGISEMIAKIAGSTEIKSSNGLGLLSKGVQDKNLKVASSPLHMCERNLVRADKGPYRDSCYNEKELSAALTVIKKIMKMNAAEPFNSPVDPVALGVPDYFDIIDTPMDFGTICHDLERGYTYKNSKDVFKDVQFIWENCNKYNNNGGYMMDLMRRVKKKFMKYWTTAQLYIDKPNNVPSGTKVYSPPAAKAISSTSTSQHPYQSADGVSASTSNKEVDEFDGFDPRGSILGEMESSKGQATIEGRKRKAMKKKTLQDLESDVPSRDDPSFSGMGVASPTSLRTGIDAFGVDNASTPHERADSQCMDTPVNPPCMDTPVNPPCREMPVDNSRAQKTYKRRGRGPTKPSSYRPKAGEEPFIVIWVGGAPVGDHAHHFGCYCAEESKTYLKYPLHLGWNAEQTAHVHSFYYSAQERDYRFVGDEDPNNVGERLPVDEAVVLIWIKDTIQHGKRQWRNTIKHEYHRHWATCDDAGREAILNSLPSMVPKEMWPLLCSFFERPEKQAQAKRNSDSRNNTKKPMARPTQGSISLANLNYKLKKELREEYNPAKAWVLMHQSRDVQSVEYRKKFEEAANGLALTRDSDPSMISPILDAISGGGYQGGYERGIGRGHRRRGVSNSLFPLQRSSREMEMKREMEKQQQQLKEQQQQMQDTRREMEEQRRLIEKLQRRLDRQHASSSSRAPPTPLAQPAGFDMSLFVSAMTTACMNMATMRPPVNTPSGGDSNRRPGGAGSSSTE